jgi:hypothetical protein
MSDFEVSLYMSLGATPQDLLDRTRKDDAALKQAFQSRIDKGEDVNTDVRYVYGRRHSACLQEIGGFSSRGNMVRGKPLPEICAPAQKIIQGAPSRKGLALTWEQMFFVSPPSNAI